MSEFVKITGGAANIIGTASLISGAADALAADLNGLIADIERFDTPAIIGNDDPAREFKKSYNSPIATADGGSGDANMVIKDAVRDLGAQAQLIGNAASSAMTDYLIHDGIAQADIGSVIT